jgi:hypothetical protein
MTPELITKALEKYAALLGPQAVSRRFPADDPKPNLTQQLNHLLWMTQEAKGFVSTKPAKAERWLCFIQGVLWREGYYTIAEFREDNRSED